MFDWFEDAVDAVGDAVGDVVDAVGDAVDDAVEWVEEAVEDVGEAFEDAAEWVEEAVEDVGEWVEEAAVDVAEGLADAAEWVAEAVDDYVFDPVDFVTGGLIDLDYDDGRFTADIGIDGVANVSASIGSDGFELDIDAGLASFEASYDDDGFAAAGSVGLDWGPLPYVEGHVEISDEGDVTIGGKVQGVLPTPAGLLEGGLEGEFHRGADGSWGFDVSADATLVTGSGATVGADGRIAYSEEADGDYTFEAEAGASVGVVGGPEVRVGAEYEQSEIDGTTTRRVSAEASVSQDGVGEVGIGASYGRTDHADGSRTDEFGVDAYAESMGVEATVSGSYERAEDAEGNVVESVEGEAGVAGYGVEGSVGGHLTNEYDAVGNLVGSDSGARADFDFDAGEVTELVAGQLGLDADTAQSVGAFAGSLQSGDLSGVAQGVADLAGAGDLSEAVGAVADAAGTSVADIATTVLAATEADDFVHEVASSEVTEALADEVWDDLTP